MGRKLHCSMSEVNASFLRAARAGNLEKVLEYLKDNIDINISNSNGLNALHLSSKEGHVEVVRELLDRSAFVDAATKKGNTALHISSLAGQQQVVELLVKFHANVDCRSQNGFTPLYMAAQENHIDVVRFLLNHNANQSLATEDGFTPLAVALQQGHEKVVAILLENDSKGKIRLPALHIAAKKNDVKAAALLLNNDPNMDLSPEARMVNCTTKSGFTPLHIAAHYGNSEIAKFLISKGADVNFEARQNITPLHVATKWGKANSVNLLLDSGAKIDVKTRDGLTPLHCAARSGHDQIVELLFTRGAPINAKTKNGLTSLHMAAQGDHVEAARILLYHSPKLVDQTTCDYLTALHVAAHCGHVKIAKLLLDHKADVNSRALNGFTPLHIACKKNRIKVIELLIKNGASKEATTESGLTPLHVASFMGCMNVVVFLIQHGSQPNVPTIRGETPLHLASRANQTDIVRILLRHGANVDAKAKEQQTPLHIATRLGNTDIIALLLRHGAFVDAATSDGYTALHIASKEGQEEVASILFENGASLNVTTKKGFTPLHISSKYGNIKVASLLLQRKAQPDIQGKNGLTPLHVATHYNRPSVAHLLLQHGASPHIVAKNGYSALHIAAKKNQIDIATTLLEYQAKTNCESNAGFTPLHLACQEGHIDMSSLLLTHQAEPGSASKNGLTPLHLCAQEDKVNCAAVLVKSGAGIDPQTKAGYTPLHVACHFGQINMVKFLLQHQADVNIVTKKHGFTSLHCAAQQGHVPIVKLLLEHGASPDITNNNGQTPLAIAQRLGYLSVIEELRVVTQTTLVSTIKTTEEKYKVQTPETMQETFMSDSEDELGDDMYHGDEQYKYLTNEGDLNNANDDSIALTPKTPKKDEAKLVVASPITPIEPKSSVEDKKEIQTVSSVSNNNLTVTNNNASNKMIAGSMGNMSMAESIDGSFYGGYDSSKNHNLHPDNIPVEARPKHAGFLISFMVDARGGAMKGCRHSGVRVIIPPRRASMPTRITCRFVRKEKLSVSPPLNESESLAARVLEMGPIGCKFLGPVVLEIPHYASLRGKEREILILRNDNGEKWYEHPIIASETAIEEALGCTLELNPTSEDGQSNAGHNDDTLSQCSSKMRITRILTNDFPKYFALISRVRHETHQVGEIGGVISSTIVPKAQAVFPEKALQKKIKLSLQAMPIPHELVAKMFGNRVAVSPIVTIEPRRRKFHKAITLTIPLPKSPLKGMINNYAHNNDSFSLRLLCSITGGLAPAQWEDITGHTPLSYVDECVSFTTTVSARFWLMDCQNVSEATKMATELYREAIAVPFMSRFIVYGKRFDITEARLRVYCITDDREEKSLEVRENFVTIAKSKEVEVLENRTQWLEVAGNILPVTKSNGEQLSMNFMAFYENRLPFIVKVKDLEQSPVNGRLVFLKDAKNAPIKSDVRSPPVCTLDIQLPKYDKEQIDQDENKKRTTVERGMKLAFFNSTGSLSSKALSTNVIYKEADRIEFNLRLLANDLTNSEKPFEWIILAQKLGLTSEETDKIRNSSSSSPYLMSSSPANQTYDMLTYWLNKYNKDHVDEEASDYASAGEILQKALKELEIEEDIINRNISSYSNISNSNSEQKTENVISVEKSFAKLNTNSTNVIPPEDRDFTKESESCAEVSDVELSEELKTNEPGITTTSIIKITEEINIRPLNPDGSYACVSKDNLNETKTPEEAVTISREQNVICEALDDENYKVTKSLTSTIFKDADGIVLAEESNNEDREKRIVKETPGEFGEFNSIQKDTEELTTTDLHTQNDLEKSVEPEKVVVGESKYTWSLLVDGDTESSTSRTESNTDQISEAGREEVTKSIVNKQIKTNIHIERDSERSINFSEACLNQDDIEMKNNKLVLELNNEEYDSELNNIEQQSPILERELINTEYELENFKSRLAMTETVSAVTQSVLDTIRSEYNFSDTVPEAESKKSELEDYIEETKRINEDFSSSNEHLYNQIDISNLNPDEIEEIIENEEEVEEAEINDCINIIKSGVESKLNEENIQLHMEQKLLDTIDTFRRESQSQIEKIIMIQEEGDDGEEVEESEDIQNDEVLLSSSAPENEDLLMSIVKDIKSHQRFSQSQARLIDPQESESDCNTDSQLKTKPVITQGHRNNNEEELKINKTLYQTFNASSSENDSDDEKIGKLKRRLSSKKSRCDDDDKIENAKYTSISSESMQGLVESNKNYISDSSNVDYTIENKNLLGIEKSVTESESREFLLQDDHDEQVIHTEIISKDQIGEETNFIEESNSETPITPVIERIPSNEFSNNLIINEFIKLENTKKSDTTHVSSSDVSTDDSKITENFKQEQIETVIGIEATNLLLSSSSSSSSSLAHDEEPSRGGDITHDVTDYVPQQSEPMKNLHEISKSLNCLESLVVSSTDASNDIDNSNLGIKKNESEQLQYYFDKNEICDTFSHQDDVKFDSNFFDKQVTSSNEPSIDQLSIHDINEHSKEEKAALATAFLFSSTIQSDYDLNTNNEEKEIIDFSFDENDKKISSNESIVVNEEYDDTEDQIAMKMKIRGDDEIKDSKPKRAAERINEVDEESLVADNYNNETVMCETENEQLSKMRHLETIEQAMTIVEHTLEKSFNLVSNIVEMVDDSTNNLSVSKIVKEELINNNRDDRLNEQTLESLKNIIENAVEKKNLDFSDSNMESNSQRLNNVSKLDENENINISIDSAVIKKKDRTDQIFESLISNDIEKSTEKPKDFLSQNLVVEKTKIDDKNQKKLDKNVANAANMLNDTFTKKISINSKENLKVFTPVTDQLEQTIVSNIKESSENYSAKEIKDQHDIKNVSMKQLVSREIDTDTYDNIIVEQSVIGDNDSEEIRSNSSVINNIVMQEFINENSAEEAVGTSSLNDIVQLKGEASQFEESNQEQELCYQSNSSQFLNSENSIKKKLNDESSYILQSKNKKSIEVISNENIVVEKSQINEAFNIVDNYVQDSNAVINFLENENTFEKPMNENCSSVEIKSVNEKSINKEGRTKSQSPNENILNETIVNDVKNNVDILTVDEEILKESKSREALLDKDYLEEQTISIGVMFDDEKTDNHVVFIQNIVENAKEICHGNENQSLIIESKNLVENVLERAKDLINSSTDDKNEEKTQKRRNQRKKNDDDHPDADIINKKKDDDDDDDDENYSNEISKLSILQSIKPTSSSTGTKTDSKADKEYKESNHDSNTVVENSLNEIESSFVTCAYESTTTCLVNKEERELNSSLNLQPLLTSSFMSESGNLPNMEVDSFYICDSTRVDQFDSNDESSSNKTLDLNVSNKESEFLNNELHNELINDSSCSFYTATESINNKGKITYIHSKKSSTSASYITAAEEFSNKPCDATSKRSMSESFYTAGDTTSSSIDDIIKSGIKNSYTVSSSYSSCTRQSSTNTSLNTSYNTCEEMSSNFSSNTTLGDLSSDDINKSLDEATNQINKELGQLNVQNFLNIYGPTFQLETNSNELKNKKNSETNSSLNSTLTEDSHGERSNQVKSNVAKLDSDLVALISKEEMKRVEPDSNDNLYDHILVDKVKDENNTNVDQLSEIEKGNQASEKKRQMDLFLTTSESNSEASSPSSIASPKEITFKNPLVNKVSEIFIDNVSCTSSVLEFEKLEMQCNLESLEEKDQSLDRVRCNKNYESENLEDKENVSCLNQVYEDADESNLIRKNFEICHDLNTIYESFEKETTSDEAIQSINLDNEVGLPSSTLSKSNQNLSSKDSPKQLFLNNENEQSNLASVSALAKSLTKISNPNLLNLSRSSSSCSIKSNDSFENEIKCRVKIDEASFFAKKQHTKKSSPPNNEIRSPGSATLMQPNDSGQRSMVDSASSPSSQLQSPENLEYSNTDICSSNDFLCNSENKKSVEEKLVLDLKKSMVKGQQPKNASISSSKPPNSNNSSSRQSRTSSSASNSSSTSLNDSARSTIVQVQNQLSKKNSFQHVHISAENLPSFRKISNPISNDDSKQTKFSKPSANIVTSTSFNSNIEYNSIGVNKEFSKLKKVNVSNPNISGNHSNNCYCHKHNPLGTTGIESQSNTILQSNQFLTKPTVALKGSESIGKTINDNK